MQSYLPQPIINSKFFVGLRFFICLRFLTRFFRPSYIFVEVVSETGLMQDYQSVLLNLKSRVFLINPVMILCVGFFCFFLMTPCTSLPL